MYLDVLVEVPERKGKITIYSKGKASYVNFEVDRVYDPSRKFNIPKRVTIGKLSEEDHDKMIPNHNFLQYFPEVKILKTKLDIDRSDFLHVGTYLVIQKVLEEYEVRDMLREYFSEEDLGLFLDLIACSILYENDALLYYPLYVREHPLFTKDMQIYDEKDVKGFLNISAVKEKMNILAPLIRNGIYKKIQKVLEEIGGEHSMTVSEGIRELEKVEIVRGKDRKYRNNMVLSLKQEMIFEAFEMDSEEISSGMKRIREQLMVNHPCDMMVSVEKGNG